MNSLSAVQDLINASLAQVNTSIPAVVLEYNSTAQTVNVEIAIKRPYYGPNYDQNPTRLLEVPVIFPQGSNWVMAGPLTKGDAVNLHFPQFDCDNWFNGNRNQVYEASTKYYHDIDGAFATPGAFTYNSPTRDSRFKDKFHIVQGDNYLTMENGKVVIESASGGARITMVNGVVTVDTAEVNLTGNLTVAGKINAPTIIADSSLVVDKIEVGTHIHIDAESRDVSPPVDNIP